MNALKFQQDLLTAHLRDTNKRGAAWLEKDTDHVVLFLNSVVAVFFQKADIALDLTKLLHVPSVKPVVDKTVRSWVEDNLLTPTEEYRVQPGNKKVRIYQARAWRTGIDQSLLKYFDLATMKLYQLEDRGAILITEKTKGFEEPVGIVMPCKI